MMAAALVRLLAVALFLSYTFVGAFVVPIHPFIAKSVVVARAKKDDDDIQELYKSVAEQDPDWFRSFVVDVLGEDSVESDLIDMLEDNSKESGEYNDGLQDTKEFASDTDGQKLEVDYFSEIRQDIELRDNVETMQTSTTQSSAQSRDKFDNEIEVRQTDIPATVADQQVKADTDIAAGSAVLTSSSNTNEEDQIIAASSGRQTGKGTSLIDATDEAPVAPTVAASTASTVTTPQQLYVQYQLENSCEVSKAPLEKFISLGYTQDELLEMEADVLDMIAVESISRPSRGVPVRWKTESPTAQLVDGSMVDKIEAKEPNSTPGNDQSEKGTFGGISSPREVWSNQSNDSIPSDAAVAPDTTPKISTGPTRPQPQATSSRVDARESSSEKDAPRGADRRAPVEPPRRRRRRTRNDEGNDRNGAPVYSPRRRGQQPTHRGRRRSFLEYKRPRKDDPPTRYWMGLDTFRNLLRAEFKLREMITFGQLEGPLLDEAEWRLELYRNWLWTLHTGVGDPVVQSRSERVQREKDRLKRERRIEGDNKRR